MDSPGTIFRITQKVYICSPLDKRCLTFSLMFSLLHVESWLVSAHGSWHIRSL